MKEKIRRRLKDVGSVAVGFAKAGEVEPMACKSFADWIANGFNAGMDYLERHIPLRRNTDNVLPGAQTVISLAFSYVQPALRDPSLPMIATYALGNDYHDVIRDRLKPLVAELKSEFGGEWRICVDSAPIEERYWAVKAGIGVLGMNGSVIVDGAGSLCFLSEILTTIEIEPDTPIEGSCDQCGRCVELCPGQAIKTDRTIESGRCISYLTIEKKGEWNDEEKLVVSHLKRGNKVLYGCDICVRCCPHNKNLKPTILPEFHTTETMLNLTSQDVLDMDLSSFNQIFRKSAIKRAGLDGLKRNAKGK